MENFQANPPPENQLHFLDYWRIIRIRKTVIMAVFLLVVITTTAVTYILPKSYSSTVRIRVEKDITDIPGLFERQTVTSYDPYFLQTEFEVIQSKAVLYNVISNLDLCSYFAKRFNIENKLETNETFLLLKKQIDVRQYRNTSIIEIRVFNEDKYQAARIANEIASQYRTNRMAQREQSSERGIEKLNQEMDVRDKEVVAAQKLVSDLRTKHMIPDFIAEGDSPAPTLDAETVRKLETDRLLAENNYIQYSELLSTLTNRPIESLRDIVPVMWPNDRQLEDLLLTSAQRHQELTALLQDRSMENPDVQRVQQAINTVDQLIESRLRGIVDGLQNKAKTAKGQIDAIVNQLEEAKRKDNTNATVYAPYFEAKRDLKRLQQYRDALSLKIFQETVDKSLPKTSSVDIIDWAEPAIKPLRPNIPLNIALGVIVGLIVGVGLAFFIEYLDTSVKTIDDVERALQAPVLGVIPQNVGNLLDEGPESPHAEAYRVLRTNLLFSRKNERLNSITVVSGGAAEGKSTTVFNLACIFAQSGQRILLVDSDLRRPSLHKFLRISNSIGLTNYLLKQNSLEEVIQTTTFTNLDFLPSGKLPSSSMGILNSTRMKDFINEVKQRYDVVFFDSPPIMGVSDASVLASGVDMVLLVVQYRKYPQLMTLRAKQMVEKVGGNLLGIVLNNINISQDSYYYYYSGYYYDYYYTKKDEDGSKRTKSRKNGETGTEQAKLEIKQKY
ncbi:MAG TPA: polysaccharide biosynthesis tyrosine autokinase [Candidatus Paceibacterota bacterium]|nr:polysaccharide biosynthesis tyrosine autokinase [Verrucomicrobiota bacterium]HRY47079.1 polysaccharide biosynthesis tyrosine autokinase [Candidatus Paceibacterota bacterium]HSA00351.1 polysaccharide biosynthesis tyrosine autokinase [Candidatus Paceibacterota bacterium]